MLPPLQTSGLQTEKNCQTNKVFEMYASQEPLPSPGVSESAEFTKRSRIMTRSDIATAIIKRMPKTSRRGGAQILDCVLQEIADAVLVREDVEKSLARGKASTRNPNE